MRLRQSMIQEASLGIKPYGKKMGRSRPHDSAPTYRHDRTDSDARREGRGKSRPRPVKTVEVLALGLGTFALGLGTFGFGSGAIRALGRRKGAISDPVTGLADLSEVLGHVSHRL